MSKYTPQLRGLAESTDKMVLSDAKVTEIKGAEGDIEITDGVVSTTDKGLIASGDKRMAQIVYVAGGALGVTGGAGGDADGSDFLNADDADYVLGSSNVSPSMGIKILSKDYPTTLTGNIETQHTYVADALAGTATGAANSWRVKRITTKTHDTSGAAKTTVDYLNGDKNFGQTVPAELLTDPADDAGSAAETTTLNALTWS